MKIRFAGRLASRAAALAAGLLLAACGTAAAGMTATVRGEVNRPGTYPVLPGDGISHLLEQAGGFTDVASLRAAVLTRKTAADGQKQELRAIVRRIEEAAGSDSGELPGEQDGKERFLAALESLTPAGRVPVRLSHPRLMKGTAEDIPLEDGDVLTVPAAPAAGAVAVAGAAPAAGAVAVAGGVAPAGGVEVARGVAPAGGIEVARGVAAAKALADAGAVAVAGAVRSPGAHQVRRKAGHRDYIRTAGGATADADLKKAWLFTADGRAVPLARPFIAWDAGNARWEFTAFRGDPVAVDAGDTVVVPKKTGRIAWLKGIPDIDALLVRIAILSGKVLVP